VLPAAGDRNRRPATIRYLATTWTAKKSFYPVVTYSQTRRLVFEFDRMTIEAFQNRVLPSKNKLFRFALKFLGNEEDAKDVVQEVFIRVWNGREQMNEVQNWEAWCMRITRNLSLDKIRSVTRKQTQPIEETFDIHQDALTPYESTEIDESMQRVRMIISTLPEKQRQVIHLRDVEGYSYNEISDILEMDMNQVKVNLFRARNAVREQLTKINAYGL
jgi:RNA polymerase sigma factor (sigma-70 family)